MILPSPGRRLLSRFVGLYIGKPCLYTARLRYRNPAQRTKSCKACIVTTDGLAFNRRNACHEYMPSASAHLPRGIEDDANVPRFLRITAFATPSCVYANKNLIPAHIRTIRENLVLKFLHRLPGAFPVHHGARTSPLSTPRRRLERQSSSR